MATNHIRMRCGSRASNHIRMQCGSRANMHNHKMKVERNEKAEKSRKGEKVWITDSGLGSGGKAGTHHTCGGKWAEPHHIYINYCLNQNNEKERPRLKGEHRKHNYFVTSYARACFSAHMIFICRKCRISFTHWEGFLALIGVLLIGQLCLQV